MPGFTFLLTNPTLSLEAKKESERWSLSFDAKVERPERLGTFKIYFDGEEYNGYNMRGGVFIECHPSKTESETLSSLKTSDWTLSTEERPGYIDVHTIPPEYRNSESDWPRIGIITSLPSESFFCLHQASVKARAIELYASIPGPNKEGFSFGPDLDGRDIEWRIGEHDRARLDSLRVGITSGSENAHLSAPSQEAKPQDGPSIMQGAIDASKLVRAVNRLFWAVVIVVIILIISKL